MAVVGFPGTTTLALPVERVLEAAKAEVDEVLVLGWAKDGAFYFAASDADLARALVLCARAEAEIVAQIASREPRR